MILGLSTFFAFDIAVSQFQSPFLNLSTEFWHKI